ncbi:hypothetical protein [Gordonia soli]|uniref:Uncharacterized protein n=1 Tax=Gordonia soli NBRC 108243 TaxID=1223545 RepID=M0QQH7_9ACTN|nr:hypothetical protein [Gordonia soli]GAC70920.1 hypothetical protein GS4_44_00010 [Gordonia soli NBRC 108243]
MQKEVVVAIVAAAAALLAPIVAWLLSRQGQRDLRSSIRRDLDTLNEMNPHSMSAHALEFTIHTNLLVALMRDQRRSVINGAIINSILCLSFVLPGWIVLLLWPEFLPGVFLWINASLTGVFFVVWLSAMVHTITSWSNVEHVVTKLDFWLDHHNVGEVWTRNFDVHPPFHVIDRISCRKYEVSVTREFTPDAADASMTHDQSVTRSDDESPPGASPRI